MSSQDNDGGRKMIVAFSSFNRCAAWLAGPINMGLVYMVISDG